jgi:hypothetical protein
MFPPASFENFGPKREAAKALAIAPSMLSEACAPEGQQEQTRRSST